MKRFFKQVVSIYFKEIYQKNSFLESYLFAIWAKLHKISSDYRITEGPLLLPIL